MLTVALVALACEGRLAILSPSPSLRLLDSGPPREDAEAIADATPDAEAPRIDDAGRAAWPDSGHPPTADAGSSGGPPDTAVYARCTGREPGSAPPRPGASGTFRVVTSISAVDREYCLCAPEGGTGPAPVLVWLHGTGGRAECHAAMQSVVAAELGPVLIVAPQGLASGLQLGTTRRAEDAALVERALGDVRRDYDVDERRIYVMGFSQGAFFGFDWGMAHAGEIAALGMMAGASPGMTRARAAAASRRLPVMLIVGADDTGARSGCSGSCVELARATRDALVAEGWRDGADVVLDVVAGRGHEWIPGGTERFAGFFRDRPR